MGHLRERHNARGRKSTRPAKRAKHVHNTEDVQDVNPNSEIHVPKTKDQKDEERRDRLRQELLEQQTNSKFTSKKKRRLEKYIDKKLKKEERVELLQKLAQTQAELPSTVHLQTSSTLGSRKLQTNEELQAKLEDKEVRRKLEGRVKGKRHRQNAYSHSGMDMDMVGASEDDESDEVSAEIGDKRRENEPGSSRASPVIVLDEEESTPATLLKPVSVITDVTVGSALRKNEDGTIQQPKIVKRKPKGPRTMFKGWGKPLNVSFEESDAGSESSFDSSDSSLDSSDDGGVNENSDEDQVSAQEASGEKIDNNSSEDESASEEEEAPPPPSSKRKRGGFKGWAMQQLSVAKEYIAPLQTEGDGMSPVSFPLAPTSKKDHTESSGPREMRGPLGEDLHLPDTALAQDLKSSIIKADSSGSSDQQKTTKKFVNITRPDNIQTARLELPILAEEQPIVEAVRLNTVIVLCGATGSGKTTQVPQFLYEAGFGSPGSDNPGIIGITQPRRVAAMSMAARVGHELSLPPSQVAYQVRYDATTAPSTTIKFMTDGVLLRELTTDFTLSKYSVIIVDEAHERSVNTDILIGVLSRVVRLREELWKEGKEGAKPLHLIIMSATLRVSDFTENSTLFPKPPPVLSVDARQHPVAIHFARRTHPDYVTEAIKKTSKIHARLPPGGILIFLTGQNEISGVCRKLELRYGKQAIADQKKNKQVAAARRLRLEQNKGDTANLPKVAPALADVEIEEMELGDFDHDDGDFDDGNPTRDLDPIALDSDEEEEENRTLGIDFEDSDVPMHILPLYSILPTDQQMRVFQDPPEEARLVVVATNVAETSLTIPGIRYVVDCGRAKERCYDVSSGVQSFRVNWISKASADQRAGRAGRTGPGHCYRLYSSAIFENHFEKFPHPEILKMPIEGVVLQMKSMHIDTVTNFPFPTPPDRVHLHKAEVLLTRLGALSPIGSIARPLPSSSDGPITELGKSMALFPLAPRFSKMLVSGRQHGCMPFVIAIVAAISVGDPFLHEEGLQDGAQIEEDEDELSLIHNANVKTKESNKLRRRAFFKSQEIHSRLGKGLSDVFRALSVVGAYEYAGGGQQFCHDHFVRPKAMEEIHKLRAQISSIASTNFPGLDVGFNIKLKPPSDLQVKVLRQLLCAAFIDQVAVRKDLIQTTTMTGNKYATARGVPYRALGINEDVFIHPGSALYGRAPPDYVIFQEAVRSSQLWLKNLTIVNPAWLSELGKGSLCTYSKPAKNSSGELMVIPRFGPDAWELPAIKAEAIK